MKTHNAANVSNNLKSKLHPESGNAKKPAPMDVPTISNVAWIKRLTPPR